MDEDEQSGGAESGDGEVDPDEKGVGLDDDGGDDEDLDEAKELSKHEVFNYYNIW